MKHKTLLYFFDWVTNYYKSGVWITKEMSESNVRAYAKALGVPYNKNVPVEDVIIQVMEKVKDWELDD